MPNVKREVISKRVRFEILKRDKFTCRYCGGKAPEVLLHIEHIKPVSKGGTNDYENLIAACESCNSGKGARLLTDQTAIAKSRDLLEKSQAEIEQLEEMIRWRKTIANKKAKQREFVIASLEEITDCTLSDYGRADVLKAFDKYGFDICADHIASYLQDCVMRHERELKHYSFSNYIAYQQKKDTLEGRRSYFIGIVKNRTSKSYLIEIAEWVKNDERLTLGILESFIDSLRRFKSQDREISNDDFFEWWHGELRTEFGECCGYHKNKNFYDMCANFSDSDNGL